MKTLRLFLFIVLFVILISFLIKLFFAARESNYGSSHRYTIGVLRPGGTLEEVLSFDPTTKSSVILTIDGQEKNPSPEQIMGINFDGTITAGTSNPGDINGLLLDALFHRSHVASSVGAIDLVRLLLLENSIPETSQTTRSLTLPLDSLQVDKISASLFADPAFSQDNASIQIINGTAEAGFGKRLERLLSNIGANVVVVSTSQSETPKTELLYFGNETSSVRRLGQILHLLPHKGGRKTIADIVIILGQSSDNTAEF